MNALSKSKKLSVLALIAANMFPLLGVMFLGWKLFPIMFLYWLESAIVGFFNVLKMRRAEGTREANLTLNDQPISKFDRSSLIGFFIMHYGIFMAVHGAFVFTLFGPVNMKFWEVLLAFAFLFLSHRVSYTHNFLGEAEYKKLSPSELFVQPYSRIIVMHVTILGGGFVVKSMHAPWLALIIMVGLKTAIDLIAHIKQHDFMQVITAKKAEG